MIDTAGTRVAEGGERIRSDVADGLAVLSLRRPEKPNGWSRGEEARRIQSLAGG